MGTQVNLDEEAIQLLEKYCNYTPAEVPTIIGRIAREFYSTAWKHIMRSPSLMQGMAGWIPTVAEKNTQGIFIEKFIADNYLKSVELMNNKLSETDGNNIQFNPDHLLSWLTWTFIKSYNVAKKAKKYKEHVKI